MYQSILGFITEYQNESEYTQKTLSSLTDASLKQEIAPGFRTLGTLAWHLVPKGGILTSTGLRFEAPPEHSEAPDSAAEIAKAYSSTSAALIEAVQSQWTDEKLQESVTMFGQQWKNGFTLGIFLKHEIHHRGQLTILMRQAGLPVIGIYGPSKEEWISMGMEAPV
ncbi:DinB family protein [Paenibacillus sp. OAS669]|uniref:DinB family protein n=1 Tax=Paenibacillus sp. OAS669 TaxID=2663821 RepID=UPI001789EA01|nr:DinB family protein [Paenibacillus sp. OAS669]MBE1443837.1 putative damage-inducible protein DinB [Paenibacillus sp. OAS669]